METATPASDSPVFISMTLPVILALVEALTGFSATTDKEAETKIKKAKTAGPNIFFITVLFRYKGIPGTLNGC
jgi:hypothetical protein